MAGNEKRAKGIFWTLVVLGIGTLAFTFIGSFKNAWETIVWGIQEISKVPSLVAIVVSLFSIVIAIMVTIGIGAAVGTLFGTMVRFGFSIPMHKRLDNMLERSIGLLDHIRQYATDAQDILLVNQLSYEAQDIRNSWYKTRLTRFVNWLGIKDKNKDKKNE